MKQTPIAPFEGFSPKACEFLIELDYNNNTTWFHANKQRFTELLLEPMRSFITAIAPVMLEIDPDMEVSPTLGKALIRMNRQTRFSNDKSPYKHSYWCKFIPNTLPNGPGFFFEVEKESYSFGLGYYWTETQLLRAYREYIAEHPAEFEGIVAPFYNCSPLKLTDQSYARPKLTGLSEVCMDFGNRKGLSAVATLSIDDRFRSPELVGFVGEHFKRMKQWYELMLRLHFSIL